MEPKKSTLTLRLDEETTALIEQLKQKTGRITASDLVRYLIHNWDRMQTSYTEALKIHTEEARKLAEMQQAFTRYVEAYERMKSICLRE